ncbi:MAG: N-acetylmuramoyl-L-alanine amidase [Pseudomonadota bacterium]
MTFRVFFDLGLLRSGVLASAIFLAGSGSATASEPLVVEATSASLSRSAQGVRVEVDMTGRAAFRMFTLADPYRIVVDFPDVDLASDVEEPSLDAGLVEALRFGVPPSGSARLVVDLRGPGRVAEAFTETQGERAARFVMVVVGADPEQFAATAGWPEVQEPAVPAPPASADAEVLVVIDPGHGGIDPGATAGGAVEKELVFEYASEMAELINQRTGFRALLTREGDVFMGLRERVNFAREVEADVFLSLHADSLRAGDATGTSVFTLSGAASEREAAALSGSANRADTIAGVEFQGRESDVTRVLVDIARRHTAEQSYALAQTLVDALAQRTTVLSGRAHQAAGFRVLKAPDIPSILIELGFLSSDRDRARLTSSEGRSAIVEAVTTGIFAWAEAQSEQRYAPARAETDEGDAEN